jgi:hypothetical protein
MAEEEEEVEYEEVIEEVEEVEEDAPNAAAAGGAAAEEEELDPEDIYLNACEAPDLETKVKLFQDCIRTENMSEKGEWGFKSLEGLAQIALEKRNLAGFNAHFAEMLTYLKTAPRDATEKHFPLVFDRLLELPEDPAGEVYALQQKTLVVCCCVFFSLFICNLPLDRYFCFQARKARSFVVPHNASPVHDPVRT